MQLQCGRKDSSTFNKKICYQLKLTNQWARLKDSFLCSSNTCSGNESHRLGNSAGIFDTLDAISKVAGFAVHDNCWSSHRRSRNNICRGKCLDACKKQHAADGGDRKKSRHSAQGSCRKVICLLQAIILSILPTNCQYQSKKRSQSEWIVLPLQSNPSQAQQSKQTQMTSDAHFAPQVF